MWNVMVRFCNIQVSLTTRGVLVSIENWHSDSEGGVRILICTIFQFPLCKCSYRGQFYMTSMKATRLSCRLSEMLTVHSPRPLWANGSTEPDSPGEVSEGGWGSSLNEWVGDGSEMAHWKLIGHSYPTEHFENKTERRSFQGHQLRWESWGHGDRVLSRGDRVLARGDCVWRPCVPSRWNKEQ